MKFLTPEIEALSKKEGKSLAKKNTSCGIFQDCNPNASYTQSYNTIPENKA